MVTRTLIFGKNDFSNYVRNCIVWSKTHKEFWGLI
jgi:hypothetical protein